MSYQKNPPPTVWVNADATASSTSSVQPVPDEGLGTDLDISAAATVLVQVSNHPDAHTTPATPAWKTIGTYTASAAFTVPGTFNWTRLNWSGNTGTVTAYQSK
ncbi:MAG: hypothetical protein OEY97_07755 [Nitrospirota bacterium]|nr:hypothetical protein [Gammaproteobacteria bacterium]MDH5527185.1 hypothetical protein [Nitrospirota bacterium]